MRLPRGNPFLCLVLSILLAAPAATPAAGGAGMAVLDRDAVSTAYNEGEFEQVVATLEAFIKSRKEGYSRADSIFVAKHLAVVYSANSDTREKGRHYMYRLLELVPSAELMDMYVSEEIERIFERVRKEFTHRHRRFADSPVAASENPRPMPEARPVEGKSTLSEEKPAPSPGEPAPSQGKRTGRLWWWIAGGTAAAATVTWATLHWSADDDARSKPLRIPAQSAE